MAEFEPLYLEWYGKLSPEVVTALQKQYEECVETIKTEAAEFWSGA